MTTERPRTIPSSPRQPIGSVSRPPRSGATTGATPPTIIMSENARAAGLPVARSEITARPITIPAAPPSPCSSRATTSTPIVGANTAAALARTHSAAPATSGGTRPNRSESGPKTSCPAVTPTRNAVSVNCTVVAEVASSVVIRGNAGR
jgi:hypothetical protein